MNRVADIGTGRNEVEQVRREVFGMRRRESHTHLLVDRTDCVNELRKVYPSPIGPKVAVQSLSFGIPRGECFGFLGINGNNMLL